MAALSPGLSRGRGRGSLTLTPTPTLTLSPTLTFTLNPSPSPSPNQADVEVAHELGQVIVHRKYGYRGVIVGHDPSCEQEP